MIVSTVLDVLGVVLLLIIVAAGVATSKSNFSNPAVVASSIKAEVQKNISDPTSQYRGSEGHVGAVCRSGTNTDRCIIDTSDGQTVPVTAVISANGDSYSTR